MLLIDVFWGRRKSIRADMSIFWTFCSGIVLTGLSVTILVLVWRHLNHDGTLEPAEARLLLLLASSLFVGCFISALLGLALAWYLTIHYKRPLNAVASVAHDIAFGNWRQRVKARTGNEELSTLIAAFNQMCDRNEAAVAELRRASDDLAHDLKTPLTHMRLLAERMTNMSAAPQDIVSQLTNSITYMRDTLDTLLDISRTEHGIDMPTFTPMDMRQVMDSAIDLYSDIAEIRHIELKGTRPQVPAMVYGNRKRMSRVVANLLDNAFKFTPDGGHVSLALDVSPSVVTLTVSDTGIGIPEDEIPHIFDRFYRVKAQSDDIAGLQSGHGLGLSLAKAIVESYWGQIGARSVPNQETTFTISFPRCPTL